MHGGHVAVLGRQLQCVGVLVLAVQLLEQHQVSTVQLCTSTLKGLLRATQDNDGAGEREAWPGVDQAGEVPCELLLAASGIPRADCASRVFKAKRA